MASSVSYLNTAQASVGTGTVVAGILAGQRVIDMDDTIHLLEPDANPLTVLTTAMGNSEVAENPAFNWLEDALAARTVTLDTTALVSGDTAGTLVAGDGKKVGKFDLLKNPVSGEIVRVTAISTDTLTITRAFGTTAAAAVAASQIFLIIGNAYAENAGSGTMLATKTVQKTNYTQIFRTPFAFSNTLEASKLYGGDYKAYQTKKKGIEHQVKIEEQFLFGEPKEDTVDAIRGTGGLNYWITSNVSAGIGALSYAAMLDFAQVVSRYGDQSQRLLLAAPIICTVFDLWAQARLFHMTEARVFGVKLNKITTSHMDFYVKKSVLLSETSAYNNMAFALDMNTIKRRPLASRDTKLKMNIQANDVDGEAHEYITEVGLQVQNEECSGILSGVTGAA